MLATVLSASLLLLRADLAHAAGKAYVRFLNQTELPNIGLKIKLMPDAVETPPAPPSSFTYTYSDGNVTRKEEAYDPHELWIRDQIAGRWVDKHGNSLIIAIARFQEPGGFTAKHVPMAQYREKADAALSAQKEWSGENLKTWISSLTGAPVRQSRAMDKRPMSLSALIRFDLSKSPFGDTAYAFTLNRAAAGQWNAPQNWFVCFFAISPDADTARAMDAIEKEFLANIGVPRMSAKHSVSHSTTFQKPATSSFAAAKDRSPEFLASRELVINSIKNLADWWFVETDNFIILSNLSLRHKLFVQQLQNDVEYYRDAYSQFIAPRKEITAVSVIKVFGTPAEYEAYVGPALQWSSGLWLPNKKELVIKPTTSGGSSDQRKMLLQITYHEAFHQYIFYAMDQIQPAAWFNEGHACFFENVEISNRRFVISEAEYRMQALDRAIKDKTADPVEMLGMSYQQFYSGTDEEKSRNYAIAWAVIYYLRMWVPSDKNSPYADVLAKYADALWTTKNGDAATRQAFEGIDLAKFQEDFIKFWSNRGMRAKARQNRIFKDYVPPARK